MIIGNKYSGYSRDNVRLYHFGGSSSPAPAPTSTTSTTTSIPDYAQPYVERMIGRTEALSETPYQTYDRERIAGFTPMQQQSFTGAQNMQTSALTGQAGQLSGDIAQRAMGTQYDPYATGQFGAQASNYMSPYMQNVVDIQQREAQRQGDIASTQRNAKAVGAGAFGGSRQAITDAEASRNLAMQKGDIQAQGLQSAYQQAQQQFNTEQQLREQSRQYGAGLGLQGLQTALQGAGQMGTIGQQQFGQGMDINRLQNQYGGQQQQYEQGIMSQQYQDFLNQQNYPYKQLGFMSDMLRGLPLSQSSQQMYQQPPSMMSQFAGAGTAAYGLSRMADGGEVKQRPAGLAELAISRMA